MEIAECLFQALIPNGILMCNFDIPKHICDFILKLCKNPSNLISIYDKQIELFTAAYKNCSVSYAALFGIPNIRTSNQAQIFKFTYITSSISLFLQLLQQHIDSVSSFCKDIQSYNNIANSARTRELIRTTYISLNHQNQIIQTVMPELNKLFNDMEKSLSKSSMSPPGNKSKKAIKILDPTQNFLSDLKNDLDEMNELVSNSLSQTLNKIIEFCKDSNSETFNKNDSEILEIDKQCVNISSQLIPSFTNIKNSILSKIAQLFEPHYQNQFQKDIEFVSQYLNSLLYMIFGAFKVAIFTTAESNYFPLLYNMSKNLLSIISQVHHLLRYRCNFTLAMVIIKLSYQKIHNSIDDLFNQICESLRLSPTAFQTETSRVLYRFQAEVKKYDEAFPEQIQSLFKRLHRSKRFIVFTPITTKHLTISSLSTYSINFQKYVYMIAHSLIKNHYPPGLFEGMTELIGMSYHKLYNLLKSQASTKSTPEQQISFIHKLDNIQYALTIFISTFSAFGESNSNNMQIKSGLSALQLAIEVCVFDSNPDTTEMLNQSLKLFIETITKNSNTLGISDTPFDDENYEIEAISGIYLFYLRSLTLAIFHNSFIVAKFFHSIIKQLKFATDAPIEHLDDIKDLNKVFLHFLKTIQRNVFYDKSFILPAIINEIISEIHTFIDKMNYKSDHHLSTLIKSIENFNDCYNDLSCIYKFIGKFKWDLSVDDLAEIVSDAKRHLESFVNSQVFNKDEFSTQAFGLAQNLFEVINLAVNISEIDESITSSIRNAVINILDHSTTVAFDIEQVVEAVTIISSELDNISRVILNVKAQHIEFTRVDVPLFTLRLKQNRGSLMKITKALQTYRESTYGSSKSIVKKRKVSTLYYLDSFDDAEMSSDFDDQPIENQFMSFNPSKTRPIIPTPKTTGKHTPKKLSSHNTKSRSKPRPSLPSQYMNTINAPFDSSSPKRMLSPKPERHGPSGKILSMSTINPSLLISKNKSSLSSKQKSRTPQARRESEEKWSTNRQYIRSFRASK